jgi:hypothetical protein
MLPQLRAPLVIFSLLLPTITLLASAGQVPVVDGVIGGVQNLTGSHVATVLDTTTGAITREPDPGVVRTPGKLRFIENKCICGECISSML